MCGIFGYVGDKEAIPLLVEGLKKLEYRGYDSAGIAVLSEDGLNVIKRKGKISNLEDVLSSYSIPSSLGIGHTRWATHGEPSDINSHPHLSSSGNIAVVHNGIIENYIPLKEFLQSQGVNFLSETDTEVIAHLLEYYYDGSLIDTLIKVMEKLEGSFALGIISSNNPDEIIAVRKDSPLIVGIGENENFIASDIPAVLKHTKNIYILEDKEIVILRKNTVKIYDINKNEVKKEFFKINWDMSEAEKSGYDHFTMKEICEQPKVVKNTFNARTLNSLPNLELDIDVNNLDRIYIVACGTSSYAGMVAKHVIENLAEIPVEVDFSSEFRYRKPLLNDRTLVIVISQSGETADTLAALREAKKRGSKVASIVNVLGSSIAREANNVIYTCAGPEIGVAATKSFTTQLTALYLIASDFAYKKGLISKDTLLKFVNEIKTLPDKIEEIIKNSDLVKSFASNNIHSKEAFFLGRGIDYAVALEGSLKLKELSYVHSEAYTAGELKHGPLALIQKGTLVVAIVTQEDLADKMISNIKEIKARGAMVLAIAQETNKEIEKVADTVFYIPSSSSYLTATLSVIPLQLLAYYIAVQKGNDVDKPRNLAKSVTVE